MRTSVSDPHFFSVDPDPDPGTLDNVDPDPCQILSSQKDFDMKNILNMS
jgi:hypothetical protein